MGRYRAIFDGQGLLAEFEGDECTFLRADYSPPERSPLSAPQLIRDHHEPFRSMADGQIYDSKSAYRQTLKARGLEEVGNDVGHLKRPWGKTGESQERRKMLHQQMADVSDREADKVLKQLKKEARP